MALRIATLLGLIAFAVSADAAPVPKAGKTTADKLVGRWELLKSDGKAPLQHYVVVFDKDGTMTLEVGTGESVVKYTGKYKVVENAIDYELMMGDLKKAEKLDIKTLTEDELRTTDPEGIPEEFKRVKKD